MNEQRIFHELTELLESNGVEIRREGLGGAGGGLCTIRDKKIFFVDTDAATAENAHRAAQALRQTIDIDAVYLKPDVREFLEK